MLGAVCTVLIAHAFGYLLTMGLPKTGIGMLGISAADPAALARWRAASGAPETYADALASLLLGEFRRTLDGISTWAALANALAASLPGFVIGNTILAAAVTLALRIPPAQRGGAAEKALELIAFFPPFLPGFLLFAAATATGIVLLAHGDWATRLVIGLCIGVPPASLAVAMLRASGREQMGKEYVICMRARGYTEQAIARGIRRAVVLPCAASAEKILLMQVSLLIFSEAIFSAPGFGSVLILAVQRNDVNTLLLAVTAISAFVAIVRVASVLFSAWLDPRHRDGWDRA